MGGTDTMQTQYVQDSILVKRLRIAGISAPAPPFTSYDLGMIAHTSEPQFSHVQEMMTAPT